jgi:hypothetical protein
MSGKYRHSYLCAVVSGPTPRSPSGSLYEGKAGMSFRGAATLIGGRRKNLALRFTVGYARSFTLEPEEFRAWVVLPEKGQNRSG